MRPAWVPRRLGAKRHKVLTALRDGGVALRHHDRLFELAQAHQVAAPLASLAAQRQEEVPERWAERLAAVRAQNLLFEQHLGELAQRLDVLGVPWFATRGAARLFDPLIPDRLCGDVDLYILPEHWPHLERELTATEGFERAVTRGEANRSTRHLIWRPGVTIELDMHLALSPFHAEGGAVYEQLMRRRVRNAAGLWVLAPEDDYGMALIEALIEAPANRLRRLWELEALHGRLKAGERQRMRRRFGLRRWASQLPEFVFRRVQGTVPMQRPEQLMVRYGGLSTLIFASRRPLHQTRSSLGLMLRRFRT